jgi:hypothetical protein
MISSSVCFSSRLFAAWNRRNLSAPGPGSNDAASARSIASSPSISSCTAISSSSRPICPAIMPLIVSIASASSPGRSAISRHSMNPLNPGS